MEKIKIISNSFNPELEFYFNEPINLYIDLLCEVEPGKKNILWLCEPDVISNLKSKLHLFAKQYDFIFTFDEEVLSKYNNAILHLQGYPWIKQDREYFPKKHSVSTVVGGKMMTKNHMLRQKLWFKQEKIENRDFYLGFYGGPENFLNNPILPNGEKHMMFYSEFHIAIENCSIKNYFSEKILDCFISKTIPIYCGCLNIDEYFNGKGIIKFNTINECIDICNSLDKDLYNSMIPYIEENHILAQDYLIIEYQLQKTFKKINIDILWKK